jgi:ribosomal protein S18 acetylase RimI-like enzyme
MHNAPMSATCQPADLVPAGQLHQAFQLAFADYLIGPFDLPLAGWPRFLARQGVDLALSRVALGGDAVVAFALVAPRTDYRRWRLATMGAAPVARGTGAAPALLDDLVARARGQGVRGLELEVFAQNERALRLYRSRGFEVLHELHGYEGAGAPDSALAPDAAGFEIDLGSAFAWLDEAAAQIGDLPLQVTSASLAAAAGLRAWRLGTAQVVFGEDAHGDTVVHSLVDRHAGQRDAEALVRALLARRSAGVVKVPPLQRRDLGGDALRRAGLRVQPLHQLLMARPA